ncbi:hypothetical protein DW352_14030 [Pseudolabrys taiwanensis]|uniref:Uncharacterized protein n=1 Tax=Pseudolabrys taiwanensis TaxID=331696 RepID=A0A345ZX86_9HYPH|nr:hypothetical protein [Pseudolabrys taiwanensis]AXK81533.1 hypothetical protein DW352_14030 [Pseudolabrys taiwanensis]
MKQRTPFQPLDDDLDTRIETLAREKGVSTLVRPAQGEQGARASETLPAPASAAGTPATPLIASPAIAAAPFDVLFDEAPARTPMKTLNVELPDYVWTALKIRAAERKTSVRHVIMDALRRDGIAINEIDMIDASQRTRSLKAKR